MIKRKVSFQVILDTYSRRLHGFQSCKKRQRQILEEFTKKNYDGYNI